MQAAVQQVSTLWHCQILIRKCVHRCDTSTEDMVKMIQTEFENMKEIEKDLDNSVDAHAQMTKETNDLMKEFKEDKIDLDKNWNFA